MSIDCPLSCPFNPFNPNSPDAFDHVLGRGLSTTSRWIEREIGPNEWARRFDAIDRRFHPERDIPLITYETQWAVLAMAMAGEAYAQLGEKLAARSFEGLRNDARIVIEKLAQSQVLLLEVEEASDALPYYPCRDLLRPDYEYLYVDFGEQDPLEKGAVLFGRFLQHENCVYVVPGIFVGSGAISEVLVDEVETFLKSNGSTAFQEMQGLLPEIWNLCASVQDEVEGVDEDAASLAEEDYEPEEGCVVELALIGGKPEAVLALRDHDLFEEEEPPEFGVDPLGESVFRVSVSPAAPSNGDLDFEDAEDFLDEEERVVKVGTVYLDAERVRITALNPVELELVKALVKALIGCREEL